MKHDCNRPGANEEPSDLEPESTTLSIRRIVLCAMLGIVALMVARELNKKVRGPDTKAIVQPTSIPNNIPSK